MQRAVTFGIVTCGGLCPGLNAIIRAIVYTAYNYYGIKNILGFPNGYQGLNPAYKLKPIKLNLDKVDYIVDHFYKLLYCICKWKRGENKHIYL